MDFEDTLLLFFPIMATYFGKLGCLQNEEPYSAGATGAGIDSTNFRRLQIENTHVRDATVGGGVKKSTCSVKLRDDPICFESYFQTG